MIVVVFIRDVMPVSGVPRRVDVLSARHTRNPQPDLAPFEGLAPALISRVEHHDASKYVRLDGGKRSERPRVKRGTG